MSNNNNSQKAPSGNTTSSYQKWKDTAQEGEYQFHARDTWRRTEHFHQQTKQLFECFGFTSQQFAGKTVVDLGAGSMLRAKFFQGANIIAIEPLADRIIENIEWTDIKEAQKVYSTPAEERIEELVGKADFLFSMNVLDHCYNLDKIIDNIRDYLAPDGVAFLSFDKHDVSDDMHPLHLNEEICRDLYEKSGFRVDKMSTGTNGILPNDTYGHGPYCINSWLSLPG